MRVHDIVLGPIIFLLGLGLCTWAATLPHPGSVSFGPGVFPTLIGGGMALAGLGVGIGGVKKLGKQKLFSRPDWLKSSRQALNFWLIPATIVAYLLLADPLGFLMTATCILFVLMAANGIKPLSALIISILTATLINVLFASLLHVPLPWGPLTSVSGWLIW